MKEPAVRSGDAPRLTLWERVKYTMVRPDDDSGAKELPQDRPVEEIEQDIRLASDKERAIGLIAAPVGAAIAFLIIGTLIDHDPASGTANHVNPSLYHELLGVLLGLSLLVLVTALWRKRLFLGISLALYGLAVFNLHYWGFGVPFLLAGAWYLVRAYRLQQELKRADPDAATPPRRKSNDTSSGRPRANKRYTPPTLTARTNSVPARRAAGAARPLSPVPVP